MNNEEPAASSHQLPEYRQNIARILIDIDADVVKVAIANFSELFQVSVDFNEHWSKYEEVSAATRRSLMEQPHDWGFHTFAMAANPAAMWECVAAGFANCRQRIHPGWQASGDIRITGEFACEESFSQGYRSSTARRHSYHPSEYLQSQWNTIEMLDRYLEFFQTTRLNI